MKRGLCRGVLLWVALAFASAAFAVTQYGPVKSKDTLWSIAKQFRPGPKISMQDMMKAIVALNPESFIGGRFNTLKVGSVLTMPTAAQIQQVKNGQPISVAPVPSAEKKKAVTATAQSNSSQQRAVEQPPVAPSVEQRATAVEPTPQSQPVQTTSSTVDATVSQEAEAPAAASSVHQAPVRPVVSPSTHLGGLSPLGSQATPPSPVVRAQKTVKPVVSAEASSKKEVPTSSQTQEEGVAPTSAGHEQFAAVRETAGQVTMLQKQQQALLDHNSALKEQLAALQAQVATLTQSMETVQENVASVDSRVEAHQQQFQKIKKENAQAVGGNNNLRRDDPALLTQPTGPERAAEDIGLRDTKGNVDDAGFIALHPFSVITIIVVALVLLVLIFFYHRHDLKKRSLRRIVSRGASSDALDDEVPSMESHDVPLGEPVVEGESQDNSAFANPLGVEFLLAMSQQNYDQAEQLISDALKEQPNNLDLRIRLLEVYAAAGKQDEFEALAAECVASSDADDLDIITPQITAMRASAWPKDAKLEEVVVVDEEKEEEAIKEGAEDEAEDKGQEETVVNVVSSDAADVSGAQATVQEEEKITQTQGVDDQVDENEAAVEAIEEPAPSEATGEQGSEPPPEKGSEPKVQVNVSDGKETKSVELSDGEEAVVNLDEEPDQEQLAAIRLDEEDADEDAPKGDLLSGVDAVESQLDAAKVYIKSNDHESARKVLRDVLKQGSAEQQDTARTLLDQIEG